MCVRFVECSCLWRVTPSPVYGLGSYVHSICVERRGGAAATKQALEIRASALGEEAAKALQPTQNGALESNGRPKPFAVRKTQQALGGQKSGRGSRPSAVQGRHARRSNARGGAVRASSFTIDDLETAFRRLKRENATAQMRKHGAQLFNRLKRMMGT